MVRKHLNSRCPIPGARSNPNSHLLKGANWVGVPLRTKGAGLLTIGAYFEHSIGMTDGNVSMTEEISHTLRECALPFLIAADWNMTPEELEASPWLERIGGVVVRPENVSFTCSAGVGRVIDFVVVSKELEQFVKVTADARGGWATHKGLFIELEKEFVELLERKAIMAAFIPLVAGPDLKTWDQVPPIRSGVTGETPQYPVASFATCADLDNKYHKFSAKAEVLLGSRAGFNIKDGDAHLGRGSSMKWKMAKVFEDTNPLQLVKGSEVGFWGKVNARLREDRKSVV